ncbi:MAG: Nuclease-related domain protein [Firmicutes bacterium ADurb.Bin182]|nr:MAG: Nuclease-related domain protein [Firmicutes bacterium ADurb.Bin182]
MDYGKILSSVDYGSILKAVWPVFILMIAGVLFKVFFPKIKGSLGERYINSVLSSLPKDKYYVLNNIMLKTDRGTSQVDHIIVSVYGIFVIETKTYKGWIFGNEYEPYWTQNIYGKKNRFDNPIRQNYGHVKALDSLLTEYKNIPIIPIVAFSGECDLKVKLKQENVVYFSGVKKLIKQYKCESMDRETALKIYELIKHNNIDSMETRKEHVASIRAKLKGNHEQSENSMDEMSKGDSRVLNETHSEPQIINSKPTQEEIAVEITASGKMICSRCGAEMVKRKATRGENTGKEFWGCSAFPKCRNIINI